MHHRVERNPTLLSRSTASRRWARLRSYRAMSLRTTRVHSRACRRVQMGSPPALRLLGVQAGAALRTLCAQSSATSPSACQDSQSTNLRAQGRPRLLRTNSASWSLPGTHIPTPPRSEDEVRPLCRMRPHRPTRRARQAAQATRSMTGSFQRLARTQPVWSPSDTEGTQTKSERRAAAPRGRPRPAPEWTPPSETSPQGSD